MYAPTYNIMVRYPDGKVIKAFTWCRGLEQGIQRAIREAADFGVTVAEVWGEKIEEQSHP